MAFWSLADRAADGRLDLAAAIVALQAAIGVSAIAFGGLNWALDGAAAPVAAVVRLESVMPPGGRPGHRRRVDADARPAPVPSSASATCPSATRAGRSCSTGST